MATDIDTAEFTFSWLALKLLGRGLYSNPWSALSELVANGLDAGATQVYVSIDARTKAAATIEIIDDGSGMSRQDIDTYVKVGFNKRESQDQLEPAVNSGPMGRKGIGKLAALYLSRHFFLQTRHASTVLSWELDARDGSVSDDQNPRLVAVPETPSTANDRLWHQTPQGTRLILTGVDLTGYGTESINALGARLANQFLLPDNKPPFILIWVRSLDAQDEPDYHVVEKSVAFGNLLYIDTQLPDQSVRPIDIDQLGTVTFAAKGLPGDRYKQRVETRTMRFDSAESLGEVEDLVDRNERTYRGIPYELTGWIGLHASIDSGIAKNNDPRFRKNKFYNPAQIRVYVRGKLASDRLLSQLGLTGTYVNYIEGEITFDLLDDDNLTDIATSNRQDFDETDTRVQLLRSLVRPIVRNLIARRNALASEIAKQARAERERRETKGKNEFNAEVRTELDKIPGLTQSERVDLQAILSNKIKGDVQAKEEFRVFISHANKDEKFATFIDEVLRGQGAKKKEIFYTSRPGSVEQNLDQRSLSTIIKESIVDANTLLFYMTSTNFMASQYCLFEGGAGWATRGVSDFLKLNMDYKSIPTFLTNGKAEMSVITNADGGKNIVLSFELHQYLVEGVFNPMIAHLNRGRKIAGKKRIKKFKTVELPPAIDLAKTGSTPLDYRIPQIVAHWDAIVAPHVTTYLASYT